MRSTRTARTAGASVWLLCSVATAHELPVPGTFGFEVVGENVASTSGVTGQITVLSDANPTVPVGVCTLAGPIDTSHNSGTWQAFVARGIARVFDPSVSIAPVLAVPTTGPSGAVALDFVDTRSLFVPPVSQSIGLGFGTVPYDVLVSGTSMFILVDQPGGANAIVFEITVPLGLGPVPALTDFYFCSGRSSPFASRMSIDPISGELVVPLLNSIDTFVTGTGTSPAPTNSFVLPFFGVTQFQVGTNVATGVIGPAGENMIVGLRQPTGVIAHGFLMFSAGVGVGAPIYSGANPFGARVLAPGFHEIAISSGANAPVATLLADSLPLSCANPNQGAVGQVTLNALGQLLVATTPCPSPFGDPEARRNPTGDPVLFMARCGAIEQPPFTPAQDSICAIGTGAITAGGILNPLGSLATAVLPGFIVPSHCDRPISLPLVGPNHEATVSNGAGAFIGTVIAQLTPGPTITGLLTSNTIPLGPNPPASAGATTLANSLNAGLLGPLPISTQGFQDTTNFGVSDHLVLGVPIGLPNVVFLAPPLAGSPSPMTIIPPGGLVLFPPNPAAPAPALGVRSGFNFVNGQSTAPAVIHPQHLFIGGAFVASFVAVADPLLPALTNSYLTLNPIVTEVFSF